MYKRIVLILLFSLLILTPDIIKADCSYEQITRIKKIAANVSLSYSYEIKDKNINFTITINNLHPDIYIKDKIKKQTYYYTSSEIIVKGYSAGTSPEFEIVSNYNGCKGELLLTNYVALPYYNSYYNDPLCKGIENYKLCQRFNRIDLSYEKFTREITAYKESLNKQPEPIPEKPSSEIVTIILDFLTKYNAFIFIPIIVICGSLIFYLVRKDDFDLKVK